MATVLVPIAPGCEELEAVTVIDLLRRAQIEVVVAGLEEGFITASRGTVLLPDITLDQALSREYDMIVLPGGQPGSTHLQNDERIAQLLQRMANEKKFTAAICAAPKALAAAGILDDKRSTGYPGTLTQDEFPKIHIESGAIVTDGNVVTSRGPGTAMDFALALIELLQGKENRDTVEQALARPPEHVGIPLN